MKAGEQERPIRKEQKIKAKDSEILPDFLRNNVQSPEELQDILKDLPPDKRKLIAASLTRLTISSSSSYSSPIPPASELERYEKILPGCTRKIFELAKTQSSHRQKLESIAIPAQVAQGSRGQIFAFVIAIVGLLMSFVLVLLNHDVAGTILGGTDLIGLVALFIAGKNAENKKEDQD